MITLDRIGKRYCLGSGQGGLRTTLTHLPRALAMRGAREEPNVQYLWALRDVSFNVRPGETLGIVGRNGAGKTTILKVLSRITQPTEGKMAIEGRIGALIELGAGFHPDLTGLENVYLYGTILGLTRREVDRRLDSIVEFSELSAFMDTPVKRYSSGMYARLAFSVAAHIDPDVLLIDEVLSVGDINFQQKCLDFIHSFVRGGKTTLFISHNHYAVEQLCQQLVWMDHGHVMMIGEPSRVLDQYLRFLDEDSVTEADDDPNSKGTRLQVVGVSLTDTSGRTRDTYEVGEDVVVNVEYDAPEGVESPRFCIWVSSSMAPNPLFAANMVVDGTSLGTLHGRGSFRCVFKHIPLMPRLYHVWIEAWGAERADVLVKWQRWAKFRVVDPVLARDIEGRRGALYFVNAHGPIKVDYEWCGLASGAADRSSNGRPECALDNCIS